MTCDWLVLCLEINWKAAVKQMVKHTCANIEKRNRRKKLSAKFIMSVSNQLKNGELVTSLSNDHTACSFLRIFQEAMWRRIGGGGGFTLQALWESIPESWWQYVPGHKFAWKLFYSEISLTTGVYFIRTLILCPELNWKQKKNLLIFIRSTVDFWSYSSTESGKWLKFLNDVYSLPTFPPH